MEQFGDRAIEDEGRLKNLNIREHCQPLIVRLLVFAILIVNEHDLTLSFCP